MISRVVSNDEAIVFAIVDQIFQLAVPNDGEIVQNMLGKETKDNWAQLGLIEETDGSPGLVPPQLAEAEPELASAAEGMCFE